MKWRTVVCLALLVGLSAGATLHLSCGAPPSQYAPLFVNNTFYLCCNMYYPSPRFNDVNYQSTGNFIPLGTQVKVTRMTDLEVSFIEAATNRPFSWVKRYAKVPLASLLSLWFVNEDPRPAVEAFDENTKSLIYAGKIAVGMTKQQVIMALGFPPHHKTPDTSMDTWTYWKQAYYTVLFQNGVVINVPQ